MLDSFFALLSPELMTWMEGLQFPGDSGPIYRETKPGPWPVEPYNTYSNLIFVGIVLFWGKKVYADLKNHRFLAGVLPVILISYIGGTAYHGSRMHQFWLYLDWVPIMLLCLALIAYLVSKIVNTLRSRSLLFLALMALFFGLRYLPMSDTLRISLGYIITALTLALPFLFYLKKTHWKNAGLVFTAFAVFGAAVYFRSIDLEQDWFPMGTHWLWHLLGGVAVHLLISYLYKDNLVSLRPSETKQAL